MQTALADFKRRMRKVIKHNVREEDEKYFLTSYARVNRLKEMAVLNKHAAITGLPKLSEAMAKEVAKAIILLKGMYQKKHRIAHEEGSLNLLPKPMAYKGSAEAWCLRMANRENLIAEPIYEENPKPSNKSDYSKSTVLNVMPKWIRGV